MTQVSEKTIDLIRKLLSLAANNPNEAEATAAAEKAQQLLERHNLDMSAIGTTAQGRPRKDQRQKGGLYSWQRQLWEAVAKLNFCHYISIKGLGKGSTYEHRLIGSQVNVLSTELMADYLQGAIERMAQTWAKENGHKSVFVREAIAYREGMTYRIVQRLNDRREELLAEERRKASEEKARAQHPNAAPSSTALTLVDVKLNEEELNNDYLNGWEEGTTTKMRLEREAREAAWHAKLAAEKAEHDRKYAEDEEYRRNYDEKQVAAKKESDEWWANYLKKAEKSSKRRSSTPRVRAETEQEKRMRLSSFREGMRDGATVGLDKQVNENTNKRIK